MKKKILITGSAGFIGTHLSKELKKHYFSEGMDLLAPGNFASCLRAKLTGEVINLSIHSNFLDELTNKPEIVIHLAAETGISGSRLNPELYFHQNLQGTFNVLEQCRKNGVKYLIYASSSSVYESNQSVMHEDSPHNNQLSFYGTTKRMTEIMVENYCRQFGITAIGLRFFTVYGSWTRPDMAAYKFMTQIDKGESITLYNYGEVYRDFTHVSDVVQSIYLLIDKIVKEPLGKHQLFNLGNGCPNSVFKYAELIAKNLEKELKVNYSPLPENELLSTHSDTSKLERYIDYKPNCSIEEGVQEMVNWFKINRYE